MSKGSGFGGGLPQNAKTPSSATSAAGNDREERQEVSNWRTRSLKGSALEIPLLPQRARERGAKTLPHTPRLRLIMVLQGQGCAAPVLPFIATPAPLR